LTGYQATGTLGRLIFDGAKKAHIMGEEITIHAHVENILGYSGHKDSEHLVEFVENTAKTAKKVFVVMGEPHSAMFLAQKLRDNLNVKAFCPTSGDSIFIE
jgi:metallo-beta-lactamase family protein